MATYDCIQIANLSASPPVVADAGDVYGKVRIIRFTYTTLGTEADTETIEFARLYSGATVIPFGKVFFDDLGTDITLSIGYAAYVNSAGTSVAADPDAFLAATDVTTAAGSALLAATAGKGFFANPKGTINNEYVSVIGTLDDAGTLAVTADKVIDGWLMIVEE